MKRFSADRGAACAGIDETELVFPELELAAGDRVRIYVTNNLPAPTSVDWYGVLLPCGMDGSQASLSRLFSPARPDDETSFTKI